jgi:hypothetical protein
MSTLFSRGNAVVKVDVASAQDFTNKEGYFFKIASNTKATPIAATTDVPYGVVLDGSQGTVEISALPSVGGPAPVKVKLGAAVTDLSKDLTIKADGTVESDDGAGARVVVARPLETGDTDELIDALLVFPDTRS